VRLTALVLVALALSACESNQERSAKLRKTQEREEVAAVQRRALAARALNIARASTKVHVISTAVVKGSEGTAAVVTLRNVSSTPLSDVPIQIDVKDAHGASVYKNDIPGLSSTLVSIALLPAHALLTWIDDQVQATGTPASVSAEVGEGTPSPARIPQLSVQGAHLAAGQGGELEGSLVNRSQVAQQELVIDAVARRAGRVLAAGRAVLAQATAGSSTPFQIFFVGDPSGAQLEVSAPATTSG
jgi:hypothetical protein